jgi:hypothetical protein
LAQRQSNWRRYNQIGVDTIKICIKIIKKWCILLNFKEKNDQNWLKKNQNWLKNNQNLREND